MIDTINGWFGAIETLFAHVHVVAIVVGLLCGLGFAYLVKVPIALMMLDEGVEATDASPQAQWFRWVVRLMGFAAGTAAAFVAWPNGMRAVWAVAVGLMVSPAYHLLGPLQRRFAPWLSVTREPPDATDEAGV